MDAPTLQAQLFPHISRSISLFKSVQSPKKPQGIEGGCSEFTGIFDIAVAKALWLLNPSTLRLRSGHRSAQGTMK